MFFIASKVLSILISPLSWVLLLLFAAWKFSKKRKQLLLISILLLYLFSNEFLFCEAMRSWETLPQKQETLTKHYETGIVLGGFASYDVAYDRIGFHESSDRLFIALKLYNAHVIQKILISGGSASLRKPFTKEAEVVRHYLTSIGISERDILIEPESKNTYQNALNTKAMLTATHTSGPHLLLTSGYHMPRAMGCFKKVGLAVDPYSVDRIVGPRKFHLEHLLLPNVHTLTAWNILLHEWIGYISYWMKDYL
jgi:uncharacterized SAM-binding protein YcdF (DUF218 family)